MPNLRAAGAARHERRRSIAAWLIVPAAEGVRRAIASLRHNRSVQFATAGAGTLAAVGVVVLARPADDTEQALAPPAPVTAPQNPATAPPVATDPPPSSAAARDPCRPPVPLDDLEADPRDVIGCSIAPTALTAVDVDDDEGFWAETAARNRVRVQLIGRDESPIEIEVGGTYTAIGVIADPATTRRGSADVRITRAEYLLHVRYGDIDEG